MNALVLFWVTTGADGQNTDRIPSLRVPVSVRDTITVTKSTTTKISSPAPSKSPRDRTSAHVHGERTSSVIDFNDLYDDSPKSEFAPARSVGGHGDWHNSCIEAAQPCGPGCYAKMSTILELQDRTQKS